VIKRLLLVGGLGLVLVCVARFALLEVSERRWERRRQELLALALVQPELQRPWEVRVAEFQERLRSSPGFRALGDGRKPYAALGSDEPRALNDLERAWIVAAEQECTGLDEILAELRGRPIAELEWHGPTASLRVQRELANILCARAWVALEAGDGAGATRAYADALRLLRATDDGGSMGGMIQLACDGKVLRSLRAALAFGLSPAQARAELVPLLAELAYSPERAERAIRRDLAPVVDLTTRAEEPWQPLYALEFHAGVEQAIPLVHGPLQELLRVRDEPEAHCSAGGPRGWIGFALRLHEFHARGNVALTALAVAAFREAHGEYPESLGEVEDLPREQALDPLTGTELPYTRTAVGARIGPCAWARSAGTEEPGDAEGELYSWTLGARPATQSPRENPSSAERFTD